MEEGETNRIEFAGCSAIKEESLQDEENIAASNSDAETNSDLVKAEPLENVDCLKNENEDEDIPTQDDPNLGDFLEVDLAEIKAEPIVTESGFCEEEEEEPMISGDEDEEGGQEDLSVAGSSKQSSVQDAIAEAKLEAILREADAAYGKRKRNLEQPLFACPVCSEQFTTTKYMKLHLRGHSGEEIACPKCPFKTQFKYLLTKHTRIYHSNQMPISCRFCDYRSIFKNNVANHEIARHATDQARFACHLCPFQARLRRYLTKHLNTHAGVKRPKPGMKFCKFENCDYKTAYSQRLKEHCRTHTGERPFLCPLCNYRATIPKNLDSHMLSKHKILGKSRASVPSTAAGDGTNPALDDHGVNPALEDRVVNPARKSRVKVYECDECSLTFRYSIGLTRHKRTHTGERPFTCDTCNQSFSLKNSLVRHIQGHMKVKPYACDVCAKPLADLKTVQKHKRRFHPNTNARSSGAATV